MASEGFQTEYIEFLQDRNAELLSRLAKMKEIYENKIFSKDLNQHYLISTLMDVLNICTAVPEEIDLLFDKLSEAMSILINLLSRKSTLVQLGEKISKVLNPTDTDDIIKTSEESNSSKSSRKEPKIYLTRLSENYTPSRRNVSESHCLSPIIEISPSNSPEVKSSNKPKKTCERININPASYNYISQESPKGRFKGTKLWKKSISSTRQTQSQKDPVTENNENSEKTEARETGQPQAAESDPDPAAKEESFWVCSKKPVTESSPKCFIDYRPRRHRYARKFDGMVKEDSSSMKNENVSSDENCDGCDNAEDSKQTESSADIIGESLPGTDDECTPRTKKDLKKRKEAIVLLEDFLKKKESPDKEKPTQGRSTESRSKSNCKSPALNSSNDVDSSTTSMIQEPRSKRKAAPTNLTEPKLHTKLRRN